MADKAANTWTRPSLLLALASWSHAIFGDVLWGFRLPYETGLPIYVLRGMKTPLQQYWPQAKHYE